MLYVLYPFVTYLLTVPRITPKIHCRVHKDPSILSPLTEMNPAHISTHFFSNIHFIITSHLLICTDSLKRRGNKLYGASSRSAGQEISLHNRVHKRPPLFSILNEINPFHITRFSFKINFLILSSFNT
jgi:hypothetical protein